MQSYENMNCHLIYCIFRPFLLGVSTLHVTTISKTYFKENISDLDCLSARFLVIGKSR